MKNIVFRRSDGGISITYVSPNDDYEDIKARHVPVDATILLEGENVQIPVDRKDRDCWDFSGGKVVVDAVKKAAKEAKLNRMNELKEKPVLTAPEVAELLRLKGII